jgi:hypothetical protein
MNGTWTACSELKGTNFALKIFRAITRAFFCVYQLMKTNPVRQSAAKLLSKDEARRIASNIAELPELLKKP